ncbi:hypothetical protein T07_8715 [Trichinella nelsoni]|uniref:Uncharacterized protein n=1 Tax=Trichinella nelsoni TaxID=6336 RepID=A0A0V0RCR8_9BILA|nr:hypothetical protein T07_8715 [Trichinella nelsoni]
MTTRCSLFHVHEEQCVSQTLSNNHSLRELSTIRPTCNLLRHQQFLTVVTEKSGLT